MDNYFSLPFGRGVYERGIYPIEKDFNSDSLVSFLLVEIGSTARGKCSQLKKKRDSLLDFWDSNISSSRNGFVLPEIFRVAAHFDKDSFLESAVSEYAVDGGIKHNYLLPEQISSLSLEEKNGLYLKLYDDKYGIAVCDSVENVDVEQLYDLLFVSKRPSLRNARGYLAELLAQKIINSSLDSSIMVYNNPFLEFKNQYYSQETEVDMLLQSWSSSSYESLFAELSKQDNLDVFFDPQKNRYINKAG